MNRRFLFSSLAILVSLFINGMANSADLWPMKIGQKIIVKRTDSANPPNSWNNEAEVIDKENICSQEYFKVRRRNYNIGETKDFYWRSTEMNLYACDPDSGIECCWFRSEPVGTMWLGCDNVLFEIMEPEIVNVPFGGPFIAVVNRKHTEEEENIPYWYGYIYFVPNLGFVKEVDYWNDNPPIISELLMCTCIGDLDEDDDVDGIDLSIQVGGGTALDLIDLKNFAGHFGENNCAFVICD